MKNENKPFKIQVFTSLDLLSIKCQPISFTHTVGKHKNDKNYLRSTDDDFLENFTILSSL